MHLSISDEVIFRFFVLFASDFKSALLSFLLLFLKHFIFSLFQERVLSVRNIIEMR